MDSHEIFVQEKFKKVAKLIPQKSRVLDIGCHDGKLSSFLNSCSYKGVDGDSKLISSALKKDIDIKYADLNKDEIPFKNNEFDYVLLLDILEHVVDPKKLLEESRKRLDKNGRLIITLPNDYHLLNKIRFIFNKHLTEDPFAPFGHLHYFPIKSGEQFLIKNNLKILKKIILAPIKPGFLPQSIKNALARIFPQSFARDVLYLLSLS